MPATMSMVLGGSCKAIAMTPPPLGGGSAHYPMTSRPFRINPIAGKETT